MRKFKTAADFILSKSTNPTTSTIVEFEGYATPGDGGGAKWRHNGVTGQTVSQSPAQLGDALLNDASGNQWVIVGDEIKVEAFGGVLDGATDNSLVTIAIKTWSNGSDGVVLFGDGTYLTDNVTLLSTGLIVKGNSESKSAIKLNSGQNDNLITLTGTGKFTASNITLDQDRANQTAGHGIRSGGCDKLNLSNVTIKNAYNYGIGLQAGTSKGLRAINLTIHTTGRDGIDIKDYNNDNETFFITNYKAYNYGLDTNQQVGLDVRGPVLAVGLDFDIQGDNRGIRNRLGGAQGRSGFGSVSNINVTSDGLSTSVALDITGDGENFNVSNVAIDNVSIAVLQPLASVGGVLSNITATNIYGTDSISIGGADLMLNNISASNTVASSRIMDIESTADNFQINNFLLEDNSGNPTAVRIVSGANDCALSSGVVRNGTVSDSGTSTIQSNVRVL